MGTGTDTGVGHECRTLKVLAPPSAADSVHEGAGDDDSLDTNDERHWVACKAVRSYKKAGILHIHTDTQAGDPVVEGEQA